MDNLPSSYYLLRWSDHITNYAELFLTLREEEEFVDCSIACEDGVVGAHRLVLAGCSPYLRDLLKRSTNPHPIIFLINVSRSTVLLLMEFIYRGQAHIPHNRLHQLVTLGKSMQIKGLSQIQLPAKYTSGLPSIPRLHGSPDPVTEVRDDSLLERDSNDDEENNMANMSEKEDSAVVSVEGGTYTGCVTEKSAQQKELSSMGSAHKQDKNKHESDKGNHGSHIDSGKHSTSNKENNRESLESAPQKIVIQSRTRERSQDSPVSRRDMAINKSSQKRNLDSESTHYIPKPKCKKMEEMTHTGRERTPSPVKVQKVINTKRETPVRKGKSETDVRQDMEKKKKTSGERENNAKKVKHPVYKVKKAAPLKHVKSEPKGNLYSGGLKMKLNLGSYALSHGVEASQRYVLAKYGVNIRPKSIKNMMSFVTAFNKKKSGSKKYRSLVESTVKKDKNLSKPRKSLSVSELTGRPRKSITFDVERIIGRSKKRTEENDGTPKSENCKTCVGCMAHEKKHSH